jgi:hypothetical protein
MRRYSVEVKLVTPDPGMRCRVSRAYGGEAKSAPAQGNSAGGSRRI